MSGTSDKTRFMISKRWNHGMTTLRNTADQTGDRNQESSLFFYNSGAHRIQIVQRESMGKVEREG